MVLLYYYIRGRIKKRVLFCISLMLMIITGKSDLKMRNVMQAHNFFSMYKKEKHKETILFHFPLGHYSPLGLYHFIYVLVCVFTYSVYILNLSSLTAAFRDWRCKKGKDLKQTNMQKRCLLSSLWKDKPLFKSLTIFITRSAWLGLRQNGPDKSILS